MTYADNQMAGVEIDEGPQTIDWSAWRSREHTIMFPIPNVPSGLYYVQFAGPDNRVGMRPSWCGRPCSARRAVCS